MYFENSQNQTDDSGTNASFVGDVTYMGNKKSQIEKGVQKGLKNFH